MSSDRMASTLSDLALPRTTLGERVSRGVRKIWQRPDWSAFVGMDWPASIMDVELSDDFHAKQGRSTGRWVLEKDGKRLAVYLKRHYELPRVAGWLAALLPRGAWSPGWQEFGHLLTARELGLRVPDPVAACEYIGPAGNLQSVLVIEDLTGKLALHQAIPKAQQALDATTFRRWKAGLAEELARLSRLLHDRGYFHKDLYLCHFFIDAADTSRLPVWKDRVHVIDFHRLGKHGLTRPFYLIKDLAQFLYSSYEEGVDVRDRLRFWRAYAGKGKTHTLLARMVRSKGALYLRHNERKKAKGYAPGMSAPTEQHTNKKAA